VLREDIVRYTSEVRGSVTGGGGGVPTEQPASEDMSGAWVPEVVLRRRLTL
jgi:hypothetical protein